MPIFHANRRREPLIERRRRLLALAERRRALAAARAAEARLDKLVAENREAVLAIRAAKARRRAAAREREESDWDVAIQELKTRTATPEAAAEILGRIAAARARGWRSVRARALAPRPALFPALIALARQGVFRFGWSDGTFRVLLNAPGAPLRADLDAGKGTVPPAEPGSGRVDPALDPSAWPTNPD